MKTILAAIIFITALTANMLYAQAISRITFDAGTTISIQTGADVCATDLVMNGAFTGIGTICAGPMPVTMLSFSAISLHNYVALNWATAIELNNSGFDVERRLVKEGAPWEKTAFVKGNGTRNEPMYYSYTDNKLNAGTYSYRLKQIDYNGNFEYHVLDVNMVVAAPNKFTVSQNYPNPSNPNSRIDFQLPFDGTVSIKVYDMLGRQVAVLIDGFKIADFYSVEFDGSKLSSGVYFYRVMANGSGQSFTEIKKMILVK